MSDEKKIGKQWKTQPHAVIATPEDLEAQRAEQEPYNKPDAVTLDVFCVMRGIRDPVRIAAMRAYTAITKATVSDWTDIFKTF